MKIQSQAPITDQASFYDEEEIYLNTTDHLKDNRINQINILKGTDKV